MFTTEPSKTTSLAPLTRRCVASLPSLFSPLLCLGAVVAKRIVPHLEMNHLALRLEADEMMKWYGLHHVAGGLFVKDDMKNKKSFHRVSGNQHLWKVCNHQLL